MRRKQGAVLPIELSVLEAAIEFRVRGVARFHGFQIAKFMKEREGARLLTSHGTLYKALGRMETAGLLESVWEDPLLAAQEGRPRRRLYEVTAAGEGALAKAAPATFDKRLLEKGLAPS
jgi:DNA-binding PadR family transcriptional regulator